MKANLTDLVKVSDNEQTAAALSNVFSAELANSHYALITEQIFNHFLNEDDDAYNALVKTQRLFEAVALRNITAALCLMTELYSKAADQYAHDITDGIDLWIDSEGNEDLLSYITDQYESPDRFDMKMVYEDWITFLKEKLTQA